MSTDHSDSMLRLGRAVADHHQRSIDALGVQDELERRFRVPRKHRGNKRTVLVFAAALAAALVLLVVWRSRGGSAGITYTVNGRTGITDEWIITTVESDSPLKFSEGSTVLARPQSRMRVRQLRSDGVSLELDRGELAVAVAHQKGTHWLLNIGPYEIEVTGTRFDVEWAPASERFELVMHDGSLTLRGPGLAPRAVIAGEHLVLGPSPRDSSPKDDSPVVSNPETAASPSASSLRTAVPSASGRSDADWRGLAGQGHYREALAAAEAAGFDRLCTSLGAGELQQLGDTARFAGATAKAQRAYLTLRSRFPNTDAAAQAAFDLGVVSGSDAWFQTYLQERPKGSLAREALGRRLELAHRSKSAAAQQLAEEYLQRYPGGPYARLARSIVGAAHP